MFHFKASSRTSYNVLHKLVQNGTASCSRRRLRSASSTSLDVRLSTYSSVHCRRQSVACRSRSSVAVICDGRLTAAPLSSSSALVLNHISSHLFIPLSDFHLYSARAVTRHFWHYNRFYILTFYSVQETCTKKTYTRMHVRDASSVCKSTLHVLVQLSGACMV